MQTAGPQPPRLVARARSGLEVDAECHLGPFPLVSPDQQKESARLLGRQLLVFYSAGMWRMQCPPGCFGSRVEAR